MLHLSELSSTQLKLRHLGTFASFNIHQYLSPTTLRRWLTKLHVLGLLHPTPKGYVSIGDRKGPITTIPTTSEISGLRYKNYLVTTPLRSWLRTGTSMPRGSGTRIASVYTAIGSTRCLHTIYFIPHRS